MKIKINPYPVKVFVARLDEELMIAKETYSLVTG
jgi:acetate kinase